MLMLLRSIRFRRPSFDTVLAIAISLMMATAAVGGFLLGRTATKDAFIEKIGGYRTELGSTLLSAGSAPITFASIARNRIGDPLTAQALARAYGVAPGDHEALKRRLQDVVWIPPYQPAPFVGHIGRPYVGDDLHINAFGFRDTRESFQAKAVGTVRIFVTGGSVAWGSGAASQSNTIAFVLETLLNREVGPITGYSYEVINAAFPAWSTTQEMLLIQQRLVDMRPYAIIMFSGSNDIYWALNGRDIRWFYSYMDQNYASILNEMYKSAGHSDLVTPFPLTKDPLDCSKLSAITARNVETAAFVTRRTNAKLVFALQPNIVTTTKRRTIHEERIRQRNQDAPWVSCYQALRDAVTAIKAPNFQFLDLSASFGSIGEDRELFVDIFHFVDLGNHLIARALSEQVDWRAIEPEPVRKAEEQR